MDAIEFFAWSFIWSFPAWSYALTKYAMKVTK
jgi:hypothetical protein